MITKLLIALFICLLIFDGIPTSVSEGFGNNVVDMTDKSLPDYEYPPAARALFDKYMDGNITYKEAWDTIDKIKYIKE